MKTLIALLFTCVSAIAATATHTATIFPALTDWSVTNSVPKWDPADGTLNSVSVTVSANTQSDFYAEILDTVPRDTVARSVFWISASAGTLAASTSATNSHVQTLSAYDNVLDYGGTSGFSASKSSSASAANVTTSVAQFVGAGTVPVAASATATATYEGSGDFYFFVQTQASAIVTITYDFTPNCPPTPSCNPKPDCKPEPDDCRDDRRSSRKRRW